MFINFLLTLLLKVLKKNSLSSSFKYTILNPITSQPYLDSASLKKNSSASAQPSILFLAMPALVARTPVCLNATVTTSLLKELGHNYWYSLGIGGSFPAYSYGL